MRLSQLATGRDNNLNLLRFIAASVVLLSHCWPLTQGTDANEPAIRLFGTEMGRMAVWVFFAVSGFLVTASWERRSDLRAFAMARARRIFPGLVVMLLLTVFVLGLVFTTLPLTGYLSHKETWAYLVYNSTLLFKMRWGLPGVFGDVALNGSLWTLPYELWCYIVLGLLAAFGALRFHLSYAVAAVALLVASWFDPGVAPLAVAFTAGSAAWRWRAHIRLDGRLALAALVASLLLMYWRLPFSKTCLVLALAYASLYFAYVPGGPIRRFNRIGDYSYGIYIYAFPIQRLVHHLWPELGVFGMFVVAMPMTLAMAVLSWHLVESPALHGGRKAASGAAPRKSTGLDQAASGGA
jgi:peptidoglycan/LPS O-acetylase OafA/YrhL